MIGDMNMIDNVIFDLATIHGDDNLQSFIAMIVIILQCQWME